MDVSKSTVMPIIFFFVISFLSCEVVGRELKKLFCHDGGTITDRIVCYFDEKPSVDVNQQKMPSETILSLYIPCSIPCDQEIMQATRKINNLQQPGYRISIAQAGKEGFKIVISYDPGKIICGYDVCESISNYESLVITLHKKEVLETLKLESDTILKQACLQQGNMPKRVIVDCGHGGKDNGKVGINNIVEKDINLSIGKYVEKILKERGYCVEFTRMNDTFIALDERTSQSNRKKADIFLSIHANSAPCSKVSGIETYWTARSSLSKNFFVHNKKLQHVLEHSDQLSKSLANHIHGHVINAASQYYQVNNRKVKEAVTQVLLGTEMPAALMELGFLSNAHEAKFLTISEYQKKLASGICDGIDNYFKDLKKISASC